MLLWRPWIAILSIFSQGNCFLGPQKFGDSNQGEKLVMGHLRRRRKEDWGFFLLFGKKLHILIFLHCCFLICEGRKYIGMKIYTLKQEKITQHLQKKEE